MPDVADVMPEPITQQLLREVPILHLASAGLDRGPRIVPVGYLLNGSSLSDRTADHDAAPTARGAARQLVPLVVSHTHVRSVSGPPRRREYVIWTAIALDVGFTDRRLGPESGGVASPT